MYVMSYFRTEAEALHLAVSHDGLKWRALNDNRPILWGTVGTKTLRDPFIIRAWDGRFHLFVTNGWASDSIVHAVSGDLLSWSQQALLPVMANVPGTQNCWAPECFYDHEAQLYRLLWSSTVCPDRENVPAIAPGNICVSDHRIWATTTTDFESYTPAQLFFDPGYNVIDASVAYHDGTYLMAFKDERGENRAGTGYKAIRVVASNRGSGPFAEISELITPPLTEGPTLFRREDRWIMLYDHFVEGYYGASISADGRTWTSITEQMQFPPGLRHGGVLEVDDLDFGDLSLRSSP